MSVGTIRTGVQAALANISGLHTYDVWPDSINCPAALVRAVRYEGHTTFAGRATLHLEVVLLVASAQEGLARGQDKLDGYLDSTGASSILAALESDPTFGGTCEGSQASGWQDYGSLDVDGKEYIGCRFPLETWVTF